VRVVRTTAGELAVGRDQPGRGAWLCAESTGCVDLAQRRDGFSRALRAPVDRQAVERLRAAVSRQPRETPRVTGGCGRISTPGQYESRED
jgi:predicted RNA-binding protein YlxR (DUF448 family)